MTREAPVFDEMIHAPQRLRICAMLSAAPRLEFAVIQNQAGSVQVRAQQAPDPTR